MIVQIHGYRSGHIVKLMELEVTEGEEQTLKEMSSVIHAAAGPLDHVAVTWSDVQPTEHAMDSTNADHD